jgi:hypothetical protein
MKRQRVLLGTILLVAVCMGAVREFLFLNLNYSIDHVANQRAFSYAHSAFQAQVDGLSLAALLRLKWVLAMFFVALMAGLSIATARLLFGDHRYWSMILVGFAAIGTLALLLHTASGTIPALEGISIKLLHLLQYPVLLFFIWAGAVLGGRTS